MNLFCRLALCLAVLGLCSGCSASSAPAAQLKPALLSIDQKQSLAPGGAGAVFALTVAAEANTPITKILLHPSSASDPEGKDTGVECEPSEPGDAPLLWVCKATEAAVPGATIPIVAEIFWGTAAPVRAYAYVFILESGAAVTPPQSTAATPEPPAAETPATPDIADGPIESTPVESGTQPIYWDGTFQQPYQFGEDNAMHEHTWVTPDRAGQALCMAYDPTLGWAAVFITVGRPAAPSHRQVQNFSGYKTLSVELKGQNGGETVAVGLKDQNAPDNGSETKIPQTVTKDWVTYTFPLVDFDQDLSVLNVVSEFVFEAGYPSATVCFRNIQFIK